MSVFWSVSYQYHASIINRLALSLSLPLRLNAMLNSIYPNILGSSAPTESDQRGPLSSPASLVFIREREPLTESAVTLGGSRSKTQRNFPLLLQRQNGIGRGRKACVLLGLRASVACRKLRIYKLINMYFLKTYIYFFTLCNFAG